MRAPMALLPLLALLAVAPAVEASPVGYCTIVKEGGSGERCHLNIVCVFTEDGTEVCVPDVCGRIVCW